MSKIKLIVNREYTTRVKKKSFIVMSILGPILFAALFIVPAWMAQMEDTEVKTIAVIDSSKVFINQLPETDYIKFEYLENTSLDELKSTFESSGYSAVLYISHLIASVPSAVQLYSDEQASLSVESHITRSIEKEIERQKLRAAGVDENILHSIKTDIKLRNIIWSEDGEEKVSSSTLNRIIGYVSGFMIYMFVFMFGAQVMRGVIEEKTNRIVEIIVSAAKPFQLMMGKIIGIAAVGLTQFFIWIILTVVIVNVAKTAFMPDLATPDSQEVVAQSLMSAAPEAQEKVAEMPVTEELSEFESIIASMGSINYGVMLGSFLFYFLGGFLLYGSLFAAIGGAVDNETDTQQFMLPITIPLIIGLYVMFNAIQNPNGPVAFWFSIIPFTSPIVMMARIPSGVPYWEVTLSMVLLVLTFLGTTWMAGRIYRTGILMYGKKVNYKELWKWIKYKY